MSGEPQPQAAPPAPAAMRLVVAHGGTTSTPLQRLGTRKAAHAGLGALQAGPLEAVTEACRVLEDDPRFHAGTGGAYRFDGRTIELDAAVACSDGRFGGAASLQRVRNPVAVARVLADLPSNLLAGAPAVTLARRLGMADHDPGTGRARKQWEKLVRGMERGKAGPSENEWTEAKLRQHWNYARPFAEVFPHGFPPSQGGQRSASADTVGAVATDGRAFAAAASTSGMTAALLGRVGDAVVIGAGLLATEHGAVACSGNGDHILRKRVAARVMGWLEEGASARDAAERAVGLFRKEVDFAAVVLTRDGCAARGNRSFAWSAAAGKE